MNFDTVIVGGGLAGLTAAAYLSKAGKSVLILEKQSVTGGLVQTFFRNGVGFDSGLRSIESSRIVIPMLRHLGLDLELVRSKVTIGLEDRILRFETIENLDDYEELLKSLFPSDCADTSLIFKEIRKVMGYMDVLYRMDNPLFLDIEKNPKLLLKLLPWLVSFLQVIRKIGKLDEPVDEYLARLSGNQALIDMVAQHFFRKTPTSFALGYFHLYLDYHYPKGGTGKLPAALDQFIREHGGRIQCDTEVVSVDPEHRTVTTSAGESFAYRRLIWAADSRFLYGCIPQEQLSDRKLAARITDRKRMLAGLRGGDSVMTVYLTVNRPKEVYDKITTGHLFYTPVTNGLSSLDSDGLSRFLSEPAGVLNTPETKAWLKKYLTGFCELNTFEISIPALRDPDLAPDDRTGLIISLLWDYDLTKKIAELGWLDEIKLFLEDEFIRILDATLFPGLAESVTDRFSSTPLTIERLTNSTDGGITGWAFTNPHMPVVNRILKTPKAVETVVPGIYQAGQWTYSPSGVPIAIMTGRYAADRVIKDLRKPE